MSSARPRLAHACTQIRTSACPRKINSVVELRWAGIERTKDSIAIRQRSGIPTLATSSSLNTHLAFPATVAAGNDIHRPEHFDRLEFSALIGPDAAGRSDANIIFSVWSRGSSRTASTTTTPAPLSLPDCSLHADEVAPGATLFARVTCR